MKNRHLLLGVVAACMTMTVPSVGVAQICDRATLISALASASSGDTVTIGECRVQGPLVVPAGVTLAGEDDRDESIVFAPRGGTAIVLTSGASASRARSLTVESDGRFGIAITGSGSAVVRNVDVDAGRGIGIGADGTGSLTLRNVQLTGPVTVAGAAGVSYTATANDIALAGIVARNVGNASIHNVTVEGFARYGAMIVGSTSNISDSSFRNNLANGLLVHGGNTRLTGVRVRRTLRGSPPAGEYPAGVAFSGGAVVSTNRLLSSNNEGFGIFHDQTGNVEHNRLHAGRNATSGVWLQNGGYMQLDRTSLAWNRLAGVVAIDSTLVSADRMSVLQTRTASPTGLSTMGDGVHLIGTPAGFTSVALLGNQRVGLVAELTGSMTPSDIRFSRTLVAGRGSMLGIVLQDSTGPLALPTAGIRRIGAVAANDAAFAAGDTELELAGGGFQPCWLPAAQQVAIAGFGALFSQANDPQPPN